MAEINTYQRIVVRGKPTNEYSTFMDQRPEYCEDGHVVGSLVECLGRCYIVVHMIAQKNSSINNSSATCVEVIPDTIAVHTGQYDKNTRKIFSNDFVRVCLGVDSEFSPIVREGIVRWNNSSGAYQIDFDDGKCTTFLDLYINRRSNPDIWIEVIGDPVSTPGLLSSKTEEVCENEGCKQEVSLPRSIER